MSRIGKRGSDAPDMSLEEKVRLCRSVEMPAEEIAERTGSTVERVLSIIGDDLSIADLKIKITIMIKKRRIDRAIEILQEYIDKHPELGEGDRKMIEDAISTLQKYNEKREGRSSDDDGR